jgi:DNA repair protein RadC
MRVIKYNVGIDESLKNVLVKESSTNYPAFEKLDTPGKIVEVLNSLYHADTLAEEHLWLVVCDIKMKPIGFFEVSHGTVNSTLSNPREIFVRILLCGGSNFFLLHNHPSGESEPSKEDMRNMEVIKEAGEMMKVSLTDSIIIGRNEYYSMREHHLV